MAVSGAVSAAAFVCLFPAAVVAELGFYLWMSEKRKALLRVEKGANPPVSRDETIRQLRQAQRSLLDLHESTPAARSAGPQRPRGVL